ncbi:hypothetical protein F5884DRAFT_851000 [Xylogone sp. PMI_703]|nr:hypothetical protein F5884DRAFT_851000 [Xylogone sp. PMI_703]
MPSASSRYLLYGASAVNLITILGHTQMGLEGVIPTLTKLGKGDPMVLSAGIGWWEINQLFGIMALLTAKWAKYGVTSSYDKAILGGVMATQSYFSLRYANIGLYGPQES